MPKVKKVGGSDASLDCHEGGKEDRRVLHPFLVVANEKKPGRAYKVCTRKERGERE